MAKFNKDERTVLCVILIVAGLLLAITSGGFMMLANGLDGLGGAGNPSAEMQNRSHQNSIFRNLVLIFLIAGGGGLVFLGLSILPARTKDDIQLQRKRSKAGGDDTRASQPGVGEFETSAVSGKPPPSPAANSLSAETKVVELTELPACDSCISQSSTHVFGNVALIAYDVQTPVDAVALLRFDRCLHLATNGPNDEAFYRHRYFSLGLQLYTIQEILQSPWISELSANLDRDGRRDRSPEARHFVLALKENTVDVAADSVTVVGVYPSWTAANDAASKIVKAQSET